MRECVCGSRNVERERMLHGVVLVGCNDCGRQWEHQAGRKARVTFNPRELSGLHPAAAAEFVACLEMS